MKMKKALIFTFFCVLFIPSLLGAKLVRLYQPETSLFSGVLVFTGVQGSVSVDMSAFQEQRLDRVNNVRSGLNLYSYVLDNDLHIAAQSRSDYSKSKSSISHKRYGSKDYYNYNLIQRWFEERGFVFSKKSGTKVVENIGWGYVRCGKMSKYNTIDCTSQIITASKSTFDFFLSERGRSYTPHYKSMISKQYEWAGFGVSIDTDTKKYYLTVYYATPFVIKSMD